LNFRFLRQRRNRRAAKLKSGFVRLPGTRDLAGHASHRRKRAIDIADAEPNAMIVEEFVFGQAAIRAPVPTHKPIGKKSIPCRVLHSSASSPKYAKS
jgi:hypothetical protein